MAEASSTAGGRAEGTASRQQGSAVTTAREVLQGVARWLRDAVLPRLPAALGVLVVALAGAALGASLAPATTTTVGPLTAEVRVVPSVRSGVHLLLPPVGEVRFDTHWGPVAVQARVAQVDVDEAQALISSPGALVALSESAPEVLRAAAIRAAIVTVVCCLAGAIALALLVHRRVWRRTAQVAATVVGLLIATSGLIAATADPDRLAQPRFTGLLSQAPYIAGEVPSVLARLESYRSGLSDVVRSVTTLYATAGELPELSPSSADGVVTVLHVSDIHLNPLAYDLIDKLVPQFGVEVVVDTGDITTWGTVPESETLSRIGRLPVPYVFVRGNHDSALTARDVARNRNAVVLNGGVAEVAGLVIAGIGDPVFTPAGGDQDEDLTPRPSVTASIIPTPSLIPAPALQRARVGVAAGRSPDAQEPDAQEPNAQEPEPTFEPSGPQGRVNVVLANAIQAWNDTHPDRPVQLAAVHEPSELDPLLGAVPLVLAGHTHKRETRVDASGTRVLVEGSTGGAGITSRGLARLSDGKPLPLAASLVHIATRGERAGQVVATDAITVGGFGLTSVSLERTVVRPEDQPAPEERAPTPTATPTR